MLRSGQRLERLGCLLAGIVQLNLRSRFAAAGMTKQHPAFCNRIHRTWAPLLGSPRTVNSRTAPEMVGPFGSMST